MTPEESQELYNKVDAYTQQDVHLGRILKSIIGYLPGFALPEPVPEEEQAPPLAEEQGARLPASTRSAEQASQAEAEQPAPEVPVEQPAEAPVVAPAESEAPHAE